MSLDKAIRYKKEKRKEYRGVKAQVSSCRNHGSCSYCMKNRTFKTRKLHMVADLQLKDYEHD